MNRAMKAVTAPCIATAFLVSAAAATEPTAYQTHAELTSRINRLAANNPQLCTVEAIGNSREGRAIWALRLARRGGGSPDPDKRPALLVVANLDGDHLVGSETAIAVAERLVEKAQNGDERVETLLERSCVYVVPRANPDPAERFFTEIRMVWRRALRPDDRDRDGALDEDPSNDLDGNGVITKMRVFDPEKADLMRDPAEPRLDVKPDRDKGERAEYTVMDEGIDDDGDGELNEDPVGGVDLNMNFMHGYEEHTDGAGPHQVSEPESLALLKFVLAHQNIAVVLVYGHHDTLSKPPDGKGTYPSGAPKTISPDDVGLYKHISERFVEITELEKVPGVDPGGAFFAWAYAQFGVPSFSTPLWTRPEPAEDDKDKPADGDDSPAAAGDDEGGDDEGGDDDEALTPSGIGDISQETIDELRAAAEARGMEVTDEMMAQISPAQIEQFARQGGIEVRRVRGAAGAADAAGKAKNKLDAAWLAYSDDERGGAGFIEWRPYEHPEFGQVEIGGWVPGFKTNPPPQEVAGIADKQLEFILDLGGRLPEVSLTTPEIRRLAPGLYEIEVALVNEGYLPTGTAQAVRNRRSRPHVVRLSVEPDQVLVGQRVSRAWSIPGSGGRESYRWIIRAPDDQLLTISVYSEKYGGFDMTVPLRDTHVTGGDR